MLGLIPLYYSNIFARWQLLYFNDGNIAFLYLHLAHYSIHNLRGLAIGKSSALHNDIYLIFIQVNHAFRKTLGLNNVLDLALGLDGLGQ